MTGVAKQRFVLFGMRNGNGARPHEPMAVGVASSLQAQSGNWYDLVTPQCDQAVRRAYKTYTFAAGQLIAHYFRNGQVGQAGVQRFLQAVLQGGARGDTTGKNEVLLAVGLDDELVGRDVAQAFALQAFGE